MMKIIILFAWILLLVILFLTIYIFLEINNERIFNKIQEKISNLSTSYEKRVVKLRFMQYYTNVGIKKSYMQKLDILLERSNIRQSLPFFSSEIIFFISVMLALAGFFITYIILFNILAGLIVAFYSYMIPRYILSYMSYKNAQRVDMQLVHYVNILNNFCHVNDDIVFSMEMSIPYLREPLRSYNINFVNEVKHGITPVDAFENFKQKIENKKFKILIKNLQLCIKYNGSYIEVLAKSKNTLKDYSIERGRRKSEARKSAGTIYAIMVIAGVITYGLLQISPFLYISLQKDYTGQIIVAYNITIFLYSIYKTLVLEKFEY